MINEDINYDEFVPHRLEHVTHHRGTWSNKIEFLLACVGYAIGFGNIWRFPFKCYDNGGGAFLLPYLLAVVTAGIPVFLMELGLGQYSSLGPIKLFRRLCPAFTGVGIAMVVVSALVSIYYNMILTWTLFYLFNSFVSKLPWSDCENWWNTPNCYDSYKAKECYKTNSSYFNGTCLNYSVKFENYFKNDTSRESPAEQYFNYRMLRISNSFENLGSIQLELLGCLFLAWFMNFLCIMKGIQTSGKVVYFTAIFPYVVLIILLVRAVTLPGVSQGLIFYMKPDWSKLFTFKVWKEAYQQIFFSLGPAFGSLMTLASYNEFNHDFYRDGLIVGILNSATSIFAGFVVFSILGFMAHELETPVDKVIASGLGLAFVAYPTAITRISVAPFWSILFFFMLITIGLDSQFAMVETVLTCICDEWHSLRSRKIYVCAGLCLFFFILGIPYTMNGGIYLFQLMDNYSAGWPLIFICLMECIIITFIYGTDRFYDDIETMIGYRVCRWWKICWTFLSPISIVILLFYDWATSSFLSYRNYTFSHAATALGWSVALSSVLFIPGYMIYEWIYLTRTLLDNENKSLDTKKHFTWRETLFSKKIQNLMFLYHEEWNKNKEFLLNNKQDNNSTINTLSLTPQNHHENL